MEELGIEPEKVGEMMAFLQNVEAEVRKAPRSLQSMRAELQSIMETEPDWRKRAAIGARMVSLGLEE